MNTLLAVDPSMRSTGYAVLQEGKQKVRCLECGTIKNTPKLLLSGCLLSIRKRLSELMSQHAPSALAIEAVIFVQSHRTAISMGSARAAAILSATEYGIPVYEYAPRKVKLAVVGGGASAKNQVAFMVRALLGLTETPSADAADAIAIGLCHFQAHTASLSLRKPLTCI